MEPGFLIFVSRRTHLYPFLAPPRTPLFSISQTPWADAKLGADGARIGWLCILLASRNAACFQGLLHC